MVLSAIVVAIVLLIAYWWANQGLYSALLHFLCVVVAGAIAFALWEWVTVTFFLRGIRFDEYAWGVTLIGLFAILLFALRLVADKFAPNEPRMPTALNYGLGAVFGLGAGILSVGVVLTGWGFIQASTDILGYEGFRRSQQASGQPTQTQPNLPPTLILNATELVFGSLSQGAFTPIDSDVTLATAFPRFAELAGSAMRDSFNEGKGKISIPPDSIKVSDLAELPALGQGAYSLRIDVTQAAFDRRTMFSLSASQVRLIGDDPSDPAVAHPTEFGQQNTANDPLFYPYTFSDLTYFASSPSGAQSAAFYLVFPKSAMRGQKPKYLQIKGLRIPLPPPTVEATIASTAQLLDQRVGRGSAEVAQALREVFQNTTTAMGLGGSLIEANATINPATGNINSLPGTLMTDSERRLTSGAGEFRRGAQTIMNRELRVDSILQPPGTRIIRVDASRGISPIDLYNVDRVRALRRKAGDDASVEIVDQNFQTYQPFGYIWERQREGMIRVYLDLPPGGRWTLGNLPVTGDEDRLYLLFRLPVDTRVRGVIFRDPAKPVDKAVVAAVCDWTVPAR